ncbi:hypothetical protein TPHA_0C04190 [Tetrapisispora phaffii CBS 4417]|uniref:C2H2-type domain-containing protein n=1 Tax=Tetrapisispora phaffii (strain ATCC 24235 / CBS 4417 / NBRC 1672 / NRRL Y-8282 / UCD 70-5) TaxID=1071381 RepID=G8BQQ7_TETPH|nr:hypothetical protein TPHA_0C04190 [Tetrapisispora phaffii CBS 4417]CCE62569.1 hypothetical protein TPHA_0C04190 [Tetrapisispora phaffii CBS 4417]
MSRSNRLLYDESEVPPINRLQRNYYYQNHDYVSNNILHQRSNRIEQNHLVSNSHLFANANNNTLKAFSNRSTKQSTVVHNNSIHPYNNINHFNNNAAGLHNYSNKLSVAKLIDSAHEDNLHLQRNALHPPYTQSQASSSLLSLPQPNFHNYQQQQQDFQNTNMKYQPWNSPVYNTNTNYLSKLNHGNNHFPSIQHPNHIANTLPVPYPKTSATYYHPNKILPDPNESQPVQQHPMPQYKKATILFTSNGTENKSNQRHSNTENDSNHSIHEQQNSLQDNDQAYASKSPKQDFEYLFCSTNLSTFIQDSQKKLFRYKRAKKIKFYECKVCHKTFKRNSWLKRHFFSHSKLKNFSCNWCSGKYKRKDNLVQHIRKKHRDKTNKEPNELENKSDEPVVNVTSTPGLIDTDSQLLNDVSEK